MKIGLVHPNLMLKGGGEYVNVEIIQALRDQHEIELITFQEPDVNELNSFFDTDLDEDDFSVRSPSLSSSLMKRTEGSFFKLRNALIKNFAKKNRDDYDLLISGLNEADFGKKGLQYVHFPDSVNEQLFHETGEVTTDLTEGSNSLLYRAYLETVEKFFKYDKEIVEKNVTLCNSSFTENVYEKVFNNDAEVLNPPISIDFEDKPGFDQRENGFVCIGKVSPPKNQKGVIRILDEIREEFNIELHIIGDAESGYAEEVEDMAEERDYVKVHGRLSRDEMKEKIKQNRYGIHNFSGEHYGLAPAEMMKGGCIPFVPDRGGQVDIVKNTDEVLFSSEDEAVNKIRNVLLNSNLQEKLLEKLDGSNLNSPEEFRQEIRERVSQFEDER